MKTKITRFVANKTVRQIFARNRVDIAVTQFHIQGHEVVITGILWHSDDTDFDRNQIDALMKDFQNALPGYEVKGETENWHFNSHSIINVFDPSKMELPEEENEIIAAVALKDSEED